MEGGIIPNNNPRSPSSLYAIADSFIVDGNLQEETEMETDMEEKKKMNMMLEKAAKRLYLNKISLWNAVNFTPILSHDQLQPIMATLGFFPVVSIDSDSHPASAPVLWKEYYFKKYSAGLRWKEYYFKNYSAGAPHDLLDRPNYCKESNPDAQPHPRLPYPDIDGLHLNTYLAFFQAICVYLPPIFYDITDTLFVP